MTEPPKTVEEFDALLAKAKEAGLQPIMEWNASTSGGGLAFPLQNLMAAYGDHSKINDWVFLEEGATIDTPEFLQATQKLDEWIKNGYFPEDVNAIEYSDAAGRFGKGEGVFTFNGDWQNAGYDTDLPGKVGFFTFPEGVEPVRRRDLRHRGQVEAPGLRRVLPQLGVDRSRRLARSTSRSAARTRAARPTARCPSVSADSVTVGDPRGRRRRHREQWRDGLHRERDELHLLRELDPESPEARRRARSPPRSSSRTSRNTGRRPSSPTAARSRIGRPCS